MGEILPFRRPSGSRKPRGKTTLCRNGHHKWVVDKETCFDVKEGRLVTVDRCVRCGIRRTRAT
jgi:hypothetical protein